MTFSINNVNVHTNTSLNVSRRVASPACIAGVLVSRPNRNERFTTWSAAATSRENDNAVYWAC